MVRIISSCYYVYVIFVTLLRFCSQKVFLFQISPGVALFALFGGLAGSTLYFLAIGHEKERERTMNRPIYGLEG